jgi:PAS domain S-box-containing protein
VHVARDVTERKRAIEALRKSEEAHRRLFETMPQGVVYQNTTGAIVSANHAAEVVLGLSLDQMQGRTSLDPRWRAMHEDGSDFSGEDHPAMVALRTGQPVSGVIMGVYNPREEQTRWIKIDAVPLFKPGEPVPYQVYTTFDDITERRQFEEILRLNEQRMNSLLELSLKAGELSEEEIVQVAIEEAERLTGSRIAYLHFVHPDEQSIQLVAWSEATMQVCTAEPANHYPLHEAGIWADCVRQREPVIHNDYQNAADKKGYPEGHVHLVRHTSVPVFDQDQVALILGVGNKATDYDEADVRQLLLIGSQVMRILRRKRTQEKLQTSLREKTVLLQEVHHRVKNNLQVISSLLDMQAMTIQDPQTLQVLQDSHNRVRAMAIVHDRLYQAADLARIDAREYLESVAGYLYGIYAGRTAPAMLRFEIQDILLDIDQAIPCGLIVNELVSNALKYAFPPGHGPDNEVLVALHRRNGHLLLQVQDNGIGLPVGLEIENATSLGLRLVSILTQQLQGRLKIQHGTGTAFHITFPVPDFAEEVPS